ncbi:TorF family putative porin [Steroidobacter flavus]|uniref:TorF family putative porin n=1 Tax=Steroidobacter flavus TaxID=1842136 RepID=A0ABV8SMT0_9GAMM
MNPSTSARATFALLAATVTSAPALAQEPPASAIAASLTFSTDRMWRGLSQTAGGPAVAGEVKWNHRAGPFVGLWAANYESDSSSEAGIASLPFVGFNRDFGRVNLDTGYLYRHYSGRGRERDFNEVTVSVAYRFSRLSARLGIFHSGDHYLGGDSVYSYLDTRIPLGTLGKTPIVLSTHLGRADLPGADSDYADLQVSLAARMRWVTCALHVSHATIDDEGREEGARHGGTRAAISIFKLF